MPVGTTIFMFLKIMIAFMLLYVFIPSRVMPFDKEKDTFLDRIFAGLIHSNLVIILLVHFLVFIKTYETMSLYVALILIVLAIRVIPSRNLKAEKTEKRILWISNFFRLADEGIDVKAYVFSFLLKVKEYALKGFRRGKEIFVANPVLIVLTSLVFLVAFYIRFKHSIFHLYLGASDSYVHMVWSKMLANNQIYVAGVYPYGFEAIISALSKIFFLDPFAIVRFLGPLSGLLIVISIYYVAKRNFKNGNLVAFIAVLLYVFCSAANVTYNLLPSYIWRQISSISMEYSIVFLLPGIHFFNQYFITKNRRTLIIAAECFAVILLTHPYTAVIALIGYAFVFIIHIPTIAKVKEGLQVIGIMVLAGIVGLLPIGVGLFMGKEFHQTSLEYANRKIDFSTADFMSLISGFNERNPVLKGYLVAIGIILVLLLIGGIISKGRALKGFSRFYAALLFTSLSVYAFYSMALQFESSGQKFFIDSYRVGIFLSIFVVIMMASLIDLIDAYFIGRRLGKNIKLISCLVLFSVFCSTLPISYGNWIPAGNRYEYDEAAAAYYKIRASYPFPNWEIVSSIEQYQQVLNYGNHLNISDLAKDLADPKVKDIFLKVEYVFIFVEKRPIDSKDGLRKTKLIGKEDWEKDFPQLIGNNPTEFYYMNYENRRIIEAKVYKWAEEYMKTHKNMKVFKETDNMKIYRIEKRVEDKIDLLKKG